MSFLIDGVRQQQWLVDLPANGRQYTHSWTFSLDKHGEHYLELLLWRLARDGQSSLCSGGGLRRQIRSLIVNGDAEPKSANYLRFAIDPDAGLASRTSDDLLVDVASEADWQSGTLGDYQIIWFSNVAQFSASESPATA